MNKLIFLSVLFSFSFNVLNAQVTIGIETNPIEGALLQLKMNDNVAGANSTKGMMLPRVQLTAVNALKLGNLPEITNQVEKESHIGLTVYAPEGFGYPINCPGIYVWGGESWQKLTEEKKQDTFTDGEGNTYTYKKYGNKYWMTQNVRTIYKQGIPANGAIDAVNGLRMNPAVYGAVVPEQIVVKTSIPAGSDVEFKVKLKPTAPNIDVRMAREEYANKRGLLYTWAQAQNACPQGWNVPTAADWGNLALLHDGVLNTTGGNINYEGAGKRLKSDDFTYTSLYSSPAEATKAWRGTSPCDENNAGFDAFPLGNGGNGGLTSGGSFNWGAYFWTNQNTHPTYFTMIASGNNVSSPASSATYINYYQSLRCVRD